MSCGHVSSDEGQQLVLASLHDPCLLVRKVVVAQQVQHAVNEEEDELVDGRRAKARGLRRDVCRGEDDIPQLAGLPRRKVGVVGTLALKRENVGRPVLCRNFP